MTATSPSLLPLLPYQGLALPSSLPASLWQDLLFSWHDLPELGISVCYMSTFFYYYQHVAHGGNNGDAEGLLEVEMRMEALVRYEGGQGWPHHGLE